MNYGNELQVQKGILNDSEKNLEFLKRLLVQDPDNETLKQNIQKREKDIEEVQKKIDVLNSIIKLDSDYNEKKPMIFHYVDTDGLADDIELGSNDINYSQAYGQQRRLLELEYKYITRKPLNYSGQVVLFGSEDYDKAYNLDKEDILNTREISLEALPKENKKEEPKKVEMTHLGGKHFKANILDDEYVIFKKNGYLNIVGNFTMDWLKDNFYSLDSKLIYDKDINKIKLWNNLEFGSTPLSGLDVKAILSKDGTIKIEGDVDAIEYHHSTLKDIEEEKKSGKHFKVDEPDKDKDTAIAEGEPDRDYSGLDKMGDLPDDSLSHGAEGMEPAVPGKQVKRRSRLEKLKEKWNNLKGWQKTAIVVAGAIAVVGVGVGVAVIGPHIAEAINNLFNPEHANTASSVAQSVSAAGTVTDPTATASAAASLDYSSVGGAGHTVFTNAGDAVNNANGVISNQWFSNNPVDVFNTATNSYMGLTPEQLSDPQLMAQLAQDPNNAMLFGNSISDPSGFMGLDDVASIVTKVR